MPAFTDEQVRYWIEYGGADLYLFYRTIADESFPNLSPTEKRELFLEVLEYCLQEGYLLLKEHPDAVKWRYSQLPSTLSITAKVPRTPKEFVEYFRLFWPQSDIAHYDTEVMINLEVGGRMWWPSPENEPTSWFNDYPENAAWPTYARKRHD
ncbi:hypothetical protein [Gluconobacter japonicus]|uniref:hypothetical protein n=1 Tax=Gluconobacter japonicus TaxID=376620 RepID=UPI0039EC2B41